VQIDLCEIWIHDSKTASDSLPHYLKIVSTEPPLICFKCPHVMLYNANPVKVPFNAVWEALPSNK
jgi:hypothetical protein